jgi:hypothetical protein
LTYGRIPVRENQSQCFRKFRAKLERRISDDEMCEVVQKLMRSKRNPSGGGRAREWKSVSVRKETSFRTACCTVAFRWSAAGLESDALERAFVPDASGTGGEVLDQLGSVCLDHDVADVGLLAARVEVIADFV